MKRLGLFLLLAVAFAPQLGAKKFETLMQKGDGADLRGKTKKAAMRYEAAIAAATTPEQRVEALLAYTDAIRGAEANKDLDPEIAVSIENAFQRAVAEATDKASFKAHNDYGVFLFDRGDPARAVAVLAEGEKDLASVPPVTGARYLANLGLARYRAGQLEDALRAYRLAIERDPALDVPAVASFTVIEHMDPQRGSEEAISLIELMMNVNRMSLARSFMEKMIVHEPWHASSGPMERLLDALVTWLVRTEMTPEKIATEWVPKLEHLANDFDGEIEQKIEQLVLIYKGNELAMSFDDTAEHFSRWTKPEDRRRLSLLLRQSADNAAANDEPKRAAQRYIAAWKLDPDNIDALTYLADLLSSWEDEDSAKLFDGLIAALFDAKGLAIAAHDDAAELRLHMVLGAMFEARELWGPRHDPRSASYQYEAALRAYDRLRSGDAKTDVYAGIYANLASALEHVGDKDEAWSQYVSAAEANFKNGDIVAASLMLDRSAEIGYDPTAEQKAWQQGIAEAIEAQKSNAPLTDARIDELVRVRLSAAPEIDASKIEVSVKDGVVRLSGEAPSRHQVEEVTATVETADGVKDVKVDLVIPPP